GHRTPRSGKRSDQHGPRRVLRSAIHDTKASGSGFAPRGMDVDSKDVVWTTLSSGQLANFDRHKCKAPLNGPNATGKHCPEGWSFYAYPGPNYKNAVDSASADSAYYNFVDR